MRGHGCDTPRPRSWRRPPWPSWSGRAGPARDTPSRGSRAPSPCPTAAPCGAARYSIRAARARASSWAATAAWISTPTASWGSAVSRPRRSPGPRISGRCGSTAPRSSSAATRSRRNRIASPKARPSRRGSRPTRMAASVCPSCASLLCRAATAPTPRSRTARFDRPAPRPPGAGGTRSPVRTSRTARCGLCRAQGRPTERSPASAPPTAHHGREL